MSTARPGTYQYVTASPLPLISLLGLLLAVGCPGRRPAQELGADCMDGKDNDGDGLVDCADPDCAGLAICQGRSDGGLLDGRRDLRPDLQPVTDSTPWQPDLPPAPDGPPPSSYGSKCVYTTGVVQPCPDSQTVCVLSAESTAGFCTHACDGSLGSCPAAPGDTYADCVYTFNGQSYCAFLCRFKGVDYSCPPSYSCTPHPRAPTQMHCWP